MPEQRRSILLVDDDGQVLFVLQASLQWLGAPCEIVTSQDGREAYRLLQLNHFDLFITAIRLPGVDGLTLTELYRSVSQDQPVIWITAHGCASVREPAERLGVYKCLEKPVEVNIFRKVVQQALAQLAPDSNDQFVRKE